MIIPFYIFSFVFLAIIQAFEKIKVHTFISDFLQNFIKLISLILLIFIGIKSNAIVFSYALGILAVFLVSYFYFKFKIPGLFQNSKLKKEEKKQIKKELFSYSWPLIFTGILSWIFSYIDSFTIGYFKGALDLRHLPSIE